MADPKTLALDPSTRTNDPEASTMTLLRSILIPHDGSALSGAVVESLAPLLGEDRAEGIGVTLLHVRDGASEDRSGLETAQARLTALGGRVTRVEPISADPAGAIVDYARETLPDLVAMSTHGRSGLDRWVRGSVAERVLRACPAPLWMVNPRTRPGSVVSSILVPLDESPRAARILDPLIPIARALGAKVTLLFVDWDAATDTPSLAAKRRTERERDVREWLAEPWARLEAAGIAGAVRIVRGDVAEEILRVAEPGAFDLLAMSTHGRSGPGRWLLGSTAEKVLARARVPIFLYPVRDAG
jgi:nucleotide-binding universal stress UspA family protein